MCFTWRPACLCYQLQERATKACSTSTGNLLPGQSTGYTANIELMEEAMNNLRQIAQKAREGRPITVEQAVTFNVHNTKQMVDLCKRKIVLRADAAWEGPHRTTNQIDVDYWVAFTNFSRN